MRCVRCVQIIWRGPVFDATGDGKASREYVLALDTHDFDIKVETYSWNFPAVGMERAKRERLKHLAGKPYAENKRKLFIHHTPPGNIERGLHTYKDGIRVLNTVWETTRIPEKWVPAINEFHALAVPCRHNMDAFQRSGVTIPIFLVPHGAETRVFQPDNAKLPLQEADGRFAQKGRQSRQDMLSLSWQKAGVALKQMIEQLT